MIVLLDLTSLDTPARHRGHGRYVRELARGLAELVARRAGRLELKALTHLGLDGSYEVTDDITEFQGSADVPSPSRRTITTGPTRDVSRCGARCEPSERARCTSEIPMPRRSSWGSRH